MTMTPKPTPASNSEWNWPAIIIIAIVLTCIAFPPLLLLLSIPFVVFVVWIGYIWARVFFMFVTRVPPPS